MIKLIQTLINYLFIITINYIMKPSKPVLDLPFKFAHCLFTNTSYHSNQTHSVQACNISAAVSVFKAFCIKYTCIFVPIERRQKTRTRFNFKETNSFQLKKQPEKNMKRTGKDPPQVVVFVFDKYLAEAQRFELNTESLKPLSCSTVSVAT